MEFISQFEIALLRFFVWRGLNASSARDLSVSCATDIALSVDKYKKRKGASFQNWCFKIATFKMTDFLRAQSRLAETKENLKERQLIGGGVSADDDQLGFVGATTTSGV